MQSQPITDGRRLLKRNGFVCIQNRLTGVCIQNLYVLNYEGALRIKERLEVSERKADKRPPKLRQQVINAP